MERVKGIYLLAKSLIYKKSFISYAVDTALDTVGILRC